MIKSFFFIPGNHPKLSEKIETISSEYFIIDLEESIQPEETLSAITHLSGVKKNRNNIFVRPSLFKENNDIDVLKTLSEAGFLNWVIPKLRNLKQLQKIESLIAELDLSNVKVILLIENPQSFFSLQQILQQIKLNVVAIGFGSQDFCTETGMSHTREVLLHPRFIVSGIAKAFGIQAIDIACMEIENSEIITGEIKDAQALNFDAKFFIHPKQLDVLNIFNENITFELNEAKKILEEYEKRGRPRIFVYNGKAVEPPHIRDFQNKLNQLK